MIFDIYSNIYDNNDLLSMKNKLYCTFISINELEDWVEELSSKYIILYNKIFILQIINNNEFVCTYNIEPGNISEIPNNTILVHRKKDSNTLYTINALNELIKSLNDGILDNNFIINWNNYRNTILLTQNGELNKLNTKIHKIIEL